jgi:hypothetical protein
MNKNLFKYSSKPNRTYDFIDYIGEKRIYFLSSSEMLLKEKCLLCDVHMVSGYDYMDSWVKCPSCDCNFKTVNEIIYFYDINKNKIKSLENEIKYLNKINDTIEEKFKNKFREKKLKRINDEKKI